MLFVLVFRRVGMTALQANRRVMALDFALKDLQRDAEGQQLTII
jgi:hypothetical protein